MSLSGKLFINSTQIQFEDVFVTKKVLINTKVFCNVSNPLNLRYNKQTKFCSYILGNGQKTILGPCKVLVHSPFEKL